MSMALITAGSWLSEFFAAFAEKFAERFSSNKDIGSEISEAIMQVQMYFKVGDYKLLITDAIIVTWVAVIAMIIVVSLLAACNSISYLHLPPPAKNIAFAIGCAITAIIYVIVMTFKFVGAKGFWITLTTPIPIMIPFKLLDYVVKPLSLSLRLFGNVFAAFIFMEFLSISVPLILPGVAGLWFDIIDGIIQAVVFSYLTMSYIGENVETVNEYNEHPEEHAKKKKKEKKSKAVAA